MLPPAGSSSSAMSKFKNAGWEPASVWLSADTPGSTNIITASSSAQIAACMSSAAQRRYFFTVYCLSIQSQHGSSRARLTAG